MERNIPFFDVPKIQGTFVHASFGYGQRAGVPYGGAFLLVANPDGHTFTAHHRLFGSAEETKDGWTDLTEEQAREVAARVLRSQRVAENFAVVRSEKEARLILEQLARDAWSVERAADQALTKRSDERPDEADARPGRDRRRSMRP